MKAGETSSLRRTGRTGGLRTGAVGDRLAGEATEQIRQAERLRAGDRAALTGFQCRAAEVLATGGQGAGADGRRAAVHHGASIRCREDPRTSARATDGDIAFRHADHRGAARGLRGAGRRGSVAADAGGNRFATERAAVTDLPGVVNRDAAALAGIQRWTIE